jgi:hypothetical protein
MVIDSVDIIFTFLCTSGICIHFPRIFLFMIYWQRMYWFVEQFKFYNNISTLISQNSKVNQDKNNFKR